jgi:polysaccharide deacetylase family protein (PEP-CTERM system associated)
MNKYAVLSMDVEDWFHLDYFEKNNCDQSISTLDGLDIYLEILDEFNLKATFFVVGELIDKLSIKLKYINSRGHELGIHSYNHIRPLELDLKEFENDALRAIECLSKIIGNKPFGYRAPCFSLNRERLNILKDLGFLYDSSKINFINHPLYGQIDLLGYKLIQPFIYQTEKFFEFEISTTKVFGINFPISGGGYLRILPWFIMKFLLKKFLKKNQHYFFYIHPFELSRVKNIPFPPETTMLKRFRFFLGRNTVQRKVRKTINMLIEEGYEIVTFSDLKSRMSNFEK